MLPFCPIINFLDSFLILPFANLSKIREFKMKKALIRFTVKKSSNSIKIEAYII